MGRAVFAAAVAVVLLAPTVLAFFAGGYFDGPRLVAGTVVWLLVCLLAATGQLRLPRRTPGRLVVGGLVALAGWSALSMLWAPLSEPVVDGVQRLLLYLGVVLISLSVGCWERFARVLAPVYAAGATLVIGYGLGGRLLPGLIDQQRSFEAAGRLEQPITYWNAEGLLAAIGFILCVSISGDSTRPSTARVLAAAACVPLGVGTYLSYSRGALAALAVGLLVLLATFPTWPLLRAAVAGVVTAGVAAMPASLLEGVAVLEGSPAQRKADGLIAGGALLAAIAVAAVYALRAARREDSERLRTGSIPRARALPAVVAGVAAALLALAIAGSLGERADPREATARPTAARFASVGSPRYDYWRVGLGAFASDPALGMGAGGFRTEWLRERPVAEAAQEIHSLPLEALTELGVPGALMLAALGAGIAMAGTRANHAGALGAPVACAVCAAGGLHAAVDWDWQLPAITLPVLVMAGSLVAANEREEEAAGA